MSDEGMGYEGLTGEERELIEASLCSLVGRHSENVEVVELCQQIRKKMGEGEGLTEQEQRCLVVAIEGECWFSGSLRWVNAERAVSVVIKLGLENELRDYLWSWIEYAQGGNQ